MKYGLSKESSPPETDEKKINENSEPENKLKVPSEEVSTEAAAVTLKTHENHESSEDPTTSSIVKTMEPPESDSSSKLSVNEPIETNQIVSIAPLDTPEISAIQVRSAIPDTNTTVVISVDKTNQSFEELSVNKQSDNSETTAMICDVNDGNTTQAIMEVVESNADENSEVEMISEPPTPNDIDMSDTCPGGTVDSFVKSSVTYNFKNAPIVELSRYSWGANEQKYLRGCLFSPDGTCILTTVNKDGMHVVELPISLYDNECVTSDRPLDILTSAVHVKFNNYYF